MLLLLRNIRRKLMKENKLATYLLYAIGEILLVVVGILIAVSIDNRNQVQQQKELEKTLLIEMSESLLNDKEDAELNIELCQTIIKSSQRVLDHLNNKPVPEDSIGYYYGSLWGSTYLSSNTAAYDNLKSMGLHLISSDTLRQQITKHYSELYVFLRNAESYDHDLVVGEISPLLSSNIIEKGVSVEFWTEAYPEDVEALRENTYFKENLKRNIKIKNLMINLYKRVIDNIDQLNKGINQHYQ